MQKANYKLQTLKNWNGLTNTPVLIHYNHHVRFLPQYHVWSPRRRYQSTSCSSVFAMRLLWRGMFQLYSSRPLDRWIFRTQEWSRLLRFNVSEPRRIWLFERIISWRICRRQAYIERHPDARRWPWLSLRQLFNRMLQCVFNDAVYSAPRTNTCVLRQSLS